MLKSRDLDTAVATGIISRDQAEKLLALAAENRTPRAFAGADDERFRFLHGFNDVFLALGVAIVVLATVILANMMPFPLSFLLGPAVTWGLSEFLAKRLRTVLPSMVAALGFAYFCAAITAVLSNVAPAGDQELWKSNFAGLLAFGAAGACLGSILYYLRFRLPFALFLAAASLGYGVMYAAAYWAGTSPLQISPVIYLPVGLATFALAMWFDMSDPERLTRRADCGFWLHLVAAPLIIKPVIDPLFAGTFGQTSSVGQLIAAMAAVVGFTVIALIVDRRALLVASLAYIAITIGVVLTSLQVQGLPMVGLVLAIVGILVLVIGFAWRPIRAALIKPIAHWPIVRRLPPVAA